MRRGFIINAAVLVLVIPLLLLAAIYENVSGGIMKAQSQNVLLSRDAFAVSTVQQDLQNAVDLSLRRAYLTLTDYVISNGLLTNENASYALATLMLTGTINGVPQREMENVTLKNWFKNFLWYLNSLGLSMSPSTFDEFRTHIDILVAPLDSFHIVVRVKIKNVTIVDNSGAIKYHGDIPSSGYVYSIISVVGFEDPLLPSRLNGLYTRVIEPCSIPYPGPVYGYYNQSNVSELVLNWCYVGVNATAEYQGHVVYYPTILNRFESVPYATFVERQKSYVALAKEIQQELGIKDPFPVGIVTFLTPSPNIDPRLLGAIQGAGLTFSPGYSNEYDSVSYFYLNCAYFKDPVGQGYCITGEEVSAEYPSLHLDNVTQILLFNATVR